MKLSPATQRDEDATSDALWELSVDDLLVQLDTSVQGLTSREAAARLRIHGRNVIGARQRYGVGALLFRQFASPIILLLIFAAALSFVLEDKPTDSIIMLTIVAFSGFLGFWQERNAANAVRHLLSVIEPKTRVIRNGIEQTISTAEVVLGDVILLSAGAGIPADCRLISATDLFVNESALTGESFPTEKTASPVNFDVPLIRRANAVFLGTHVVSGSARAVVVQTGRATGFGGIASHLRQPAEETEFERGVRRFGYFLMEVTLLLVTLIFCFNVATHRPVLDSFLFALALAVGLTPQLLPVIISVNLARGAIQMAKSRVIIKRLAAIENFGSMDVLCSDKTGTLTTGNIQLEGARDPMGLDSPKTLLLARVNSQFETGYTNPIDDALRSVPGAELKDWTRVDEIPYDFVRKRLSILAEHDQQRILICKGAVQNILNVCNSAETADGGRVPLAQIQDQNCGQQSALARKGYRTLAVAVRDLRQDRDRLQHADEAEMTLMGLISFIDPPKEGIQQTIASLQNLGVKLKIITGDHSAVAETVARQIGIQQPKTLRGGDLRNMVESALVVRVEETNLFAEIEPNQKERIIRAIRAAGHVVGYMGDGINDAPAMHAADVSISVQSAVDVAKEAADIVLLERDLSVLESGVRASRRTFANTLKYVFMATSANFGNMFSMAGASFFLPFLPLLPQQILLMNLLTDVPELAIATDHVDRDWILLPHRWNIGMIRRFMCVFGVLSSLFDFLTFALLIRWNAEAGQFRTAWFLESVVSATLVVLVVRTRGSFLSHRPSRWLLWSSLLTVGAAVLITCTSFGEVFGFVRLTGSVVLAMSGIVLMYIGAAETIKHVFNGWEKISQPHPRPSG